MFFRDDNYEYADRMSRHSFTAGVTSLASSILCFMYPIFGFLFGSLGVTFACLSRPKKGKMSSPALTGLLCSVGGMAINFCVVGMTVLVMLIPGNFETAIREMDTVYEQTTGASFEEAMQDIFGFDVSPYLEDKTE